MWAGPKGLPRPPGMIGGLRKFRRLDLYEFSQDLNLQGNRGFRNPHIAIVHFHSGQVGGPGCHVESLWRARCRLTPSAVHSPQTSSQMDRQSEDAHGGQGRGEAALMVEVALDLRLQPLCGLGAQISGVGVTCGASGSHGSHERGEVCAAPAAGSGPHARPPRVPAASWLEPHAPRMPVTGLVRRVKRCMSTWSLHTGMQATRAHSSAAAVRHG